jgi:endonuclease/exonuclease/phosphatase family metal-dependent hydrolase
MNSFPSGHSRFLNLKSSLASSVSQKTDVRPAVSFGAKDKKAPDKKASDKKPAQSPRPSSLPLSGSRPFSAILKPLISAIQSKGIPTRSSHSAPPEPKLDLAQPLDAVRYVQNCHNKVKKGERLEHHERVNLERISVRFPAATDLVQSIQATLEGTSVLQINHSLNVLEQEAFDQGVKPNSTLLEQSKTALEGVNPHHSDRPNWQLRLARLETQHQRIVLRHNLEAFQQRLKNATPLSAKEWEHWQGLALAYAEDVVIMTEPVAQSLKPFPPLLRNQVWVLDYLPLAAFHQAINPALLPQEDITHIETPSSPLPWIDLPSTTQADIQLAFERSLITVDQLKGLQTECIKATFGKVATLLKETRATEQAPEHMIQIARYLEELSRRRGSFSRKQSETVELYTKLLGVLLLKQGQDFAPSFFASPTFLKASREQQQILVQALAEGIITLVKPQHLQKPPDYRRTEAEAAYTTQTEGVQIPASLLRLLQKLGGQTQQNSLLTPFQLEFLQALPHEQALTSVLEKLSLLPNAPIPFKERDAAKSLLKQCFNPAQLSAMANLSPALLSPLNKALIQNGFHQFLDFLYEDGVIQTRAAIHKLDLSHPPRSDSPLSLNTYAIHQLADPSLIKLSELYQLEPVRSNRYQSLQKSLSALKTFRQSEQGILYHTRPLQSIPDNRLAQPLSVMTYNVQDLEIPESFDLAHYQESSFSGYWHSRHQKPMPLSQVHQPQDEEFQATWKEYTQLCQQNQEKGEKRRLDLANKIRQANPDVLILQESHGLYHLLRFLQDHSFDNTYSQVIYAPAAHCPNGSSTDPTYFQCKTGIAVLAKKDVPQDTAQMELVHQALGEKPPGPRGMLSVALGKPTDRTRLQLIGAHMKALGGDNTKANDEAIQESERGQLEDYVQTLDHLPTMALGDFNHPVVQLDGLKELIPDNADIGTYCAGGARKITHHAADSTKRSANRLDKVFLKDEDCRLTIQSIQILAKENEPSDHRPVMVTVQENTDTIL